MRTLPSKMLRDTATLILPKDVDAWRDTDAVQTVPLSRVHVQRSAGIRIGSEDYDQQLNAELWYDARLSAPRGLDWIQLKRSAEQVDGFMRIVHAGVEYRVMQIRELRDGMGRVHHYHLMLA